MYISVVLNLCRLVTMFTPNPENEQTMKIMSASVRSLSGTEKKILICCVSLC